MNTDILEQFAKECDLLLSDNLINFANKVESNNTYIENKIEHCSSCGAQLKEVKNE